MLQLVKTTVSGSCYCLWGELCVHVSQRSAFPRQVYFLYLITGNLSAVINPIIYGFLNNNFWVEYKIIFFLKKHNTDKEIQEPTTERNRLKVFPSRNLSYRGMLSPREVPVKGGGGGDIG